MTFSESVLHAILGEFPTPAGWLVAFSGGLDSTVLLTAMARLRSRLETPLRAVYVHHGLLPNADAWTTHCERFCRQLRVPLEVVRLDLRPEAGESLEAQAREARYRALGERLQPDEMLLLAQHRDDQAETLLLQLLRGAGIEGLAGMPSCRPWRGGWQARPLLGFPRAPLHAWAIAQGLQWIEDPSNHDLRFDRNFLRHQVLPLLRERWPAADRTLSRSAANLADSLKVLRRCIAQDLERCRRGHALFLPAWSQLEDVRRTAVLRAWIAAEGAPAPDRQRVGTIERQMLEAGERAAPLVEWGAFAVRRYRDLLFLLPRELPAAPADCPWPDQERLVLPAGLGVLRRVPDAGGIPDRYWRGGQVVVRWHQPAVRCRLPGRAGSRSLRKLSQERGVPPWSRPLLPLIFVGDRLAAIADLWRCEGLPVEAGAPASRVVWEGRPAWLGLDGKSE